MTDPKKCCRCKGTNGPFRLVGRKYVRKDGTLYCQYLCRSCNTKWHREDRKKRGTEYTREIYKKTYLKNKEKWIARAKTNYAVKTGKLIKPTKCEVCELKKPLQGHHPDYSKPLEVMWLCTGCHADVHAEMGTGYKRTNI